MADRRVALCIELPSRSSGCGSGCGCDPCSKQKKVATPCGSRMPPSCPSVAGNARMRAGFREGDFPYGADGGPGEPNGGDEPRLIPVPPPPGPKLLSYFNDTRPNYRGLDSLTNPFGVIPTPTPARVAVNPADQAEAKKVAVNPIAVQPLLTGGAGPLKINASPIATAGAAFNPAAGALLLAGARASMLGDLGSRSSRNLFNMTMAAQGVVTNPKVFNSLSATQQANQKTLATQQAALVQAGLEPVKVGNVFAPGPVQQDALTAEQQAALAQAGLPTALAVESLATPDQQAQYAAQQGFDAAGYDVGTFVAPAPRPVAPVKAPVFVAPKPPAPAPVRFAPPPSAPVGPPTPPAFVGPGAATYADQGYAAAAPSDSFLSAPINLPLVGPVPTWAAVLGGVVVGVAAKRILGGRSSSGKKSHR